MKYFLLGIVATVLTILLAGFLYIRSSYMSVAATDAPLPFEESLAGMALRDRIRLRAPQRYVSDFTTADLVTGAQVFQTNCAFCHGLPQQPASVAGSGMFPHAPQLFTPEGSVSNDPAGVTYWKVNNGIRLTGLPSFRAALTDQQMWQVSALLAHDDKLPREVQDALAPPVAAAPRVSASFGQPKAK